MTSKPRRESIQNAYEPYFLAAVLAAQFQFQKAGFRQKDVRFLIELFTNWMESTLGDVTLPIQNVQISRYLDQLCDSGIAKKFRGKNPPRYELARAGMTKLIQALVNRPRFLPVEQVFFVFYFVKSYGRLFDEMVRDATPTMKADWAALKEPELVLKNQIRFLAKEIAKLKGRIEEAEGAAKLAQGILNAGQPVGEAVRAVEKKFPYQLNSQKPLPELMREIPDILQKWEMTEGMKNRAQILWAPLAEYLARAQAILVQLEKANENSRS